MPARVAVDVDFAGFSSSSRCVDYYSWHLNKFVNVISRNISNIRRGKIPFQSDLKIWYRWPQTWVIEQAFQNILDGTFKLQLVFKRNIGQDQCNGEANP